MTMAREKVRLSVYLPVDLADALYTTAQAAGIEPSHVIEDALRRALGMEQGRPRPAIDRGPTAAREAAEALRAKGKTLAEIADTLNTKGYRTTRGRDWSAPAVCRLLGPS